MDKEQAIHSFWSSFGLTAYDEQTVPTGWSAPKPPYITYEVVTGNINNPVSLSASLWYRGTSWAPITQKLHEIEQALSYGGAIIDLDHGKLWLQRGSPFAQRMSDDNDNLIRRIYININAEFLTEV